MKLLLFLAYLAVAFGWVILVVTGSFPLWVDALTWLPIAVLAFLFGYEIG